MTLKDQVINRIERTQFSEYRCSENSTAGRDNRE